MTLSTVMFPESGFGRIFAYDEHTRTTFIESGRFQGDRTVAEIAPPIER